MMNLLFSLEKDTVQSKAAGLKRRGRILPVCNRRREARQRSYVPYIFSKRGEGYIDVVVAVLVGMMLIVLSLNVFSFLTLKQDMDYYAKELISCATANGKTSGEVNTRSAEIAEEVGFAPEVTWTAEYFDNSDRTVQLGDTIKVTLTYRTYMEGFGVFRIPVTLTAVHSGLSQRYWK